jgi:hypothetical protein
MEFEGQPARYFAGTNNDTVLPSYEALMFAALTGATVYINWADPKFVISRNGEPADNVATSDFDNRMRSELPLIRNFMM